MQVHIQTFSGYFQCTGHCIFNQILKGFDEKKVLVTSNHLYIEKVRMFGRNQDVQRRTQADLDRVLQEGLTGLQEVHVLKWEEP